MSNPNDPAGPEGMEINFEDPGAASPYPQQAQGYTPEQLAYYQQQQAYYQQQQAYYQAQQQAAAGYYQPSAGVVTPPPGQVVPPQVSYAPPSQGPGQVSQSSRTIADSPSPQAQQPQAIGDLSAVSQSSATMADGASGHTGGGPANIHALIGRTIDRYRISKLLGEGGFGAVYKAEHTLMKRDVAFKTLHKEHATDPAVLHRFLREGQVAARFKHKHAIEVYDFGPLGDGAYFMAMEFLPGKDLRDHIKKRGALELAETFDVMIMALSGLQAAHDGGVIHRDLKPDNIKLESREGREDYVKILDFGIAKLKEVAEAKTAGTMSAEEASRLMKDMGAGVGEPPASASSYKTQVGAFFGTPEYGSPEQCAGDEIDHRSDLYTMGVIMYECLTGSLPFVSKTPQGYLAQHMVAQPRPIREIRPDLNIPAEVEQVLMKSLEKNRDDRYQSANEFIDALIQCATKVGLPITVEGGGTVVVKTPTWKLALIVLVPVMALSGVFFYIWKSRQDPEFDAIRKEVTASISAYDWTHAKEKLTSEDPITTRAKQKDPQYFEETLGTVETGLKAQEEKVGSTFGEVGKKYGAAAVENRDYQDAIEKLDGLLNSAETAKAPAIDKVKELRKKIADDEVADAEAWWKRTSPGINKALDGDDFDGAVSTLQTFPAKFKETPTQHLVDDMYQTIKKVRENLDPQEAVAKDTLTAATKFEQDHTTDWAAIFAKYQEIIDKPDFKNTRARGGAQNRLLEARKRWAAAGDDALAKLWQDAQSAMAGGKPADFSAALKGLAAFPLDTFASTKSAEDYAANRRAVLDKAEAAFHAADAKAKADHDAFHVAAALAGVEDWAGFSDDQPIAEQAAKLARTYRANKAIADAMVKIDAASVTYGEAGTDVSSPVQGPVDLKAYFMMPTEVTNEQFRGYLEDTGQLAAVKPFGWQNGTYPANQGQFPVRGVSWFEAKAFCAWAGLDLPTEVEWEHAARGPQGFVFPWGARVQNTGALAQFSKKEPAAVASFAGGDSPYGLHDMAGNVAEWTKSEFARYQNCPKAHPAYGPGSRVVRGGSYDDAIDMALRAALRKYADPAKKDPTIGFRCVRPAD
jgi:serine/threonine protein kinase/formylglycine-generating enzyme required for sulfatase activity